MSNDTDTQLEELYSVASFTSKATGRSVRLTTAAMSQVKSRTSDISRIISGIKDDFGQQEPYVGTYEADADIMRQLTKTETHIQTAAGSDEAGTDVERDQEKTVGGDGACVENSFIDEDSNEDVDDGPPMDQGYAWVVAICGLFAVFSTWGANAGYGVFLAHYLSSNTFPGASEYDFALIGGIVVSFAQFFAPLCIILYKVWGPFPTFYIGLAFQCCGFLLASFATKLWQLYLTQGVLIGLSFLFVFLPATLVLPTWFDKHRATAFGLLAGGAGLGGIFFALTVNKLIQQTGDQRWALRMCCCVTLFVGLVACSLMRPRNYKPIKWKESVTFANFLTNAKSTLSVKPYKQHYALTLITLWYGVTLMNYIIVLFLMSSYALSVGLTAKQGTILTAVLNTAQLVGRPTCGLIADRIGRFNFSILCSLALTILVFAFWLQATSYAALIVFNFVAGFILGVCNIMAQPLARDIVGEGGMLAEAWSGVNVFSSPFPLVAEVIGLAMRDKTSKRPYRHTQIFCGCLYILGIMILIATKEYAVRQKFNERLDVAKASLSETTKGGYLKNTKEDTENNEILQQRIESYELVLRPTFSAFLARCFYPMRV